MSAFVIAKRNCADWDLPVFHAGEQDDDEAIAAFTSVARAANYICDADMDGEHNVQEVAAVELFAIMVKAHEEGIRYMVINPDRARHMLGERQPVLILEEHIARSAHSLMCDIHECGCREPKTSH